MDTLVHADIFFFVTTIAVVAFCILGAIAFFYLIGILRNVKHASDKLEEKIEATSDHLEAMRSKVAESAVFNLMFMKKRKKRETK